MGWALAATVLVSFLPGLLIAALLGLPVRSLTTWAFAPVASIVAIFMLGELTDLVGLRFGLGPVLGLMVLLSAGVAFRARDAIRRPPREILANARGGRAHERRPDLAVAHWLLALGIGLGVVAWIQGLSGAVQVPNSGDAGRHAFMATRILHAGTVQVARVVTVDAQGLHPVANFYPLAAHASLAIASRIDGNHMAACLLAFEIVYLAVVLPLGMFVLARYLFPDEPLVAGFTALVVPALIFLYLFSNDLPRDVGMAFVPISVVLLMGELVDRPPKPTVSRRVASFVPAALAIVAALTVHESQIPAIGFFVAVLAIGHVWRERSFEVVRSVLVRGALVGAAALVLALPTVVELRGGALERTNVGAGTIGPAFRTDALWRMLNLRYFTVDAQTALAAVALAGLIVLIVRRRFAWIVAYVGVLSLALAGTTERGFVRTLTFPWYHNPIRIYLYVAYFVPLFAGVALASLLRFVWSRPAGRRWRVAAAAVLVAGYGGLVGVPAFASTTDRVHAAFIPKGTSLQAISPSSEKAFQWLHQHVQAGETVVNDRSFDGALWMYTEYGLSPLICFPRVDAVPSGALNQNLQDWVDRLYVLANLYRVGLDARLDRLLEHYDARWVYWDRRLIAGALHYIDPRRFAKNPRIRPVFHDGTVWVYRIVRAPGASRA